jgi:heme A synthase
MATAILVEFALGMGVNLYVTIPSHKSFGGKIFSQGLLTVHALLGVVLLAGSIAAVVRAVRLGQMRGFTILALAGILVAAFGGIGFVSSGGNGASMTMAIGTAVALFAYLFSVFRLGLPAPAAEGTPRDPVQHRG